MVWSAIVAGALVLVWWMVPTSAPSTVEAMQGTSNGVRIDPAIVQDTGVLTARAQMGPVTQSLRATGIISADETLLYTITTKFSGWIETLYVSTTGEMVSKDQSLFSIYSPEVFSAQKELHIASESHSTMLMISAYAKLRNFDFRPDQIEEMKRNGPERTVTLRSPTRGFVIEKNVIEGHMIQPGTITYRIADLAKVWVLAQIYEEDLPFLKLNQEVTVDLPFSATPLKGKVLLIYPTVDPMTRTTMVRLELDNPDTVLKPSMYVTALIHSEIQSRGLLVPANAVIRSGEKNSVIIALGNGHFEPRSVVLGPRTDTNMYQILSGVQEGEQIVTSSEFLIDSESLLEEAFQQMKM